MTTSTTNYRKEATDAAVETMEEYRDAIVTQLVESGAASNDLHNDYDNGDAYHHESHVDKEYRLRDAAELLDQLSEHEETDSGLWEGLAPREAISAQAAYTYGNAVMSEWQRLIESINERYEHASRDLHDRDDEVHDSDLRNAASCTVDEVLEDQ